MKHTIVILTAIFTFALNGNMWGAEPLKPDQTTYIWASSGLWLRSGPSANAKPLAKLPNGTALKILGEGVGSFSQVAVESENHNRPKEFSISGKWREVEAIVDGTAKRGYVFDGWLLELPPMQCSNDKCERAEDWGKRNFGKVVKKVIKPKTKEGLVETRLTLGNNITVTTQGQDGKGSTKWTLPGMSLPQGVVFALDVFDLPPAEGFTDDGTLNLTPTKFDFKRGQGTLAVEKTANGVSVVYVTQ